MIDGGANVPAEDHRKCSLPKLRSPGSMNRNTRWPVEATNLHLRGGPKNGELQNSRTTRDGIPTQKPMMEAVASTFTAGR